MKDVMKIPNAKFNNKEGGEGEIMKIRGVGKRGHGKICKVTIR